MGSIIPPKILQISSTGTPSQVGFTHGHLASQNIDRCIEFYGRLFEKKCSMDWDAVRSLALKFQPFLLAKFPSYVEEMEGIAIGSGKEYADILALNVRTEIAFGAFSDGCTAISICKDGSSYLGQNWDWMEEQAENLILLKINKADGITLQMITEAGIIGKIGFNSHGVGCTLNAITAMGVSFDKIPVHLALRTVLESTSRNEALEKLETFGVASAGHILVADENGGIGLECSSEDLVRLDVDEKGVVAHTNHYVLPHKKGVVEKLGWLPDTQFRLGRVAELLDGGSDIWGILKDEVEGDGASICRRSKKTSDVASLFGIVMDLRKKTAEVTVGRATEPTEKLRLSF